MTQPAGNRLGPYEILAPLGAGGMGEVYRAHDQRLGRDVAVKVLPEHLAADAAVVARFEREARALAAVSHPNILGIFDVGTDGGIAYVVMELLEGETLHARLVRAPLVWRDAVDIAIAAAEGLDAAHARHIVHGDIKPENLFLTHQGGVKLVDFGLARIEGPAPVSRASAAITILGAPDVLAGTVHYLSPEQVRGQQPTARSDLFAFGCMLFEMLTGTRPFTGVSAAEVLAAILRDPAPPLTGRGEAIPAALEPIVAACLHKTPERRIESARALATALHAVSDGVAPAAPRARRRARTISSVAVLPLESPGPSRDVDYLADGLTDRIIDTLSRLPKLRVMARSTVFRYKGQAVDPQAVGRELSVRAVLTGQVVQRGDGLAIRLELVDARDGARLWGHEYFSTGDDIVGLQDTLASEVSEQLAPALLQKAAKRVHRSPTQNNEAFRLYLHGRFYWNKRTRDGMLKSIEYFEQALQQDPRFALACAGLADAYSLLGGFGYLPPPEAYAKAKLEAARALELDSTLAEAHTSLATAKYRFDWDWPGAESAFRLALHHNPGYATAHHWFGVFLVLMGRFPEGLAAADRALQLDPLSLVVQWTRGYLLYYMRRYDDALEQLRATLELDPTFARAHVDIGLVHLKKGEFQAGIEAIRRGIALFEDNPGFLASLGYAYGVAGDDVEAVRIAGELATQAKRRYVSPFSMGLVAVGRRDFNAAFEWLDRSFALREDALVSLQVNPRVDALRQEPRFGALVRRVGLPVRE